MRVRLICGEDVNLWILGKFALKMEFQLKKLGIDVDISDVPDVNADVNHYIIYLHYKGIETKGINTLMITHIDTSVKLNKLKEDMKLIEMGICMSGETRDFLINAGLSSFKLNFISPAHDEVLKPRKTIIGITCRVQIDGRKREYLLKEIGNTIDCSLFSFKIMGDGWDEYVDFLRKKGFEVEYHNAFEYKTYAELIPSLDYYLYTGMDEGQMGCIDALAAGVKTIVTHQGYHLDMLDGITHTFKTKEDLIAIFKKIEKEQKQKMNAVKHWTWPFYAEKYLELWNYLIAVKANKKITIQPKSYNDGVFSIISVKNGKSNLLQTTKINLFLKWNYCAHLHSTLKNSVNKNIKTRGFYGAMKHIWTVLFNRFFNRSINL